MTRNTDAGAGKWIDMLVGDRDGTTAYRYGMDVQAEALSASRDVPEPAMDVEWVCSPDDDLDDEIMVDREVLGRLLDMASIGARYAGCTTCERVTLV